ncbi:MAG: hypothetical protein ABI205_08520 [Gemmatimonadaceae bacterium]
MRFRGLGVALAALASVALVGSAGAQAASPSGLVPIANRSYIGINPLGVPFDIFTVEAETGVAQGITLGGAGSYIDVDHDRYQSLDFKFRYYPGEVVLRGFSLGGTVGYLSYSSPACCGSPTDPNARRSVTSPTVGILTDYNWMLGLDRRFIVGTGLGAKRVLASAADRDGAGLDRAYITARFTVGLAF